MTHETLRIQSLAELSNDFDAEVRSHLSEPFVTPEHAHRSSSIGPIDAILHAMKVSPQSSICRVNLLSSTVEEVIKEVHVIMSDWISSRNASDFSKVQVTKHSIFSDVVVVDIIPIEKVDDCTSLFHVSVPPSMQYEAIFGEQRRSESGWPMTHKVVICDRLCGEAVLRGSDVFVRGVLGADASIAKGERVAVYADIRGEKDPSISRGVVLDKYAGRCVFLGLGTAQCRRADFFRNQRGLAIAMSALPLERAGPVLPPLSGVLSGKVMAQNLPSVLVGHTLDPQQGEYILDMCAAPGGKTSHLASLVNNNATIIACDKSRKKVLTAKRLFERLGASCIRSLVLDTTKCCDPNLTESLLQILQSATTSETDGMLQIKSFPPESFDRVLLDPPCSALGLRPKLFLEQFNLEELKSFARHQQRFVDEAVKLLKPGGVMTYSTCTFHHLENEGVLRYMLEKYPNMELLPIEFDLGSPGLPVCGFSDAERNFVRRFNPSDEWDTIGFFVAKLRKRSR